MAYWRGRSQSAGNSSTSGTEFMFFKRVEVNPTSASTAIVVADESRLTHTGGDISAGGGHDVAKLDYFVMSSSGKTVALAIAHEAKFDVVAGTVTTGVINENQVGQNAGTITTLIGSRVYVDSNAGTISNLYSFFNSDNSGIAGITAKYSFGNLDPGAPLYNVGASHLLLPVILANYTFATLPSAAAYSGFSAVVTDNGAGNFPVDVYSNGTNWIIKDGSGTLAS